MTILEWSPFNLKNDRRTTTKCGRGEGDLKPGPQNYYQPTWNRIFINHAIEMSWFLTKKEWLGRPWILRFKWRGKRGMWNFCAHPSFDSHLSYRLALLHQFFRLLSLIIQISVPHRTVSAKKTNDFRWRSIEFLRTRSSIFTNHEFNIIYPLPRFKNIPFD